MRRRFIALAALLLALIGAPEAKAQVWACPDGSRSPWSQCASTGGFNFPGTPYAIYSGDKVVSAYAGNAINVTRLSDSTSQDIGFSGSNFNVAAFNTFCGAGNSNSCYVTTRYDQTGGGHNLTCTITNSNCAYPIVVNGVLYFSDGPGLMEAPSFFPAAGDLTIGMAGVWKGGTNTGVGWVPIANFDGTGGYFTTLDGLNGDAINEFSFWQSGSGEIHTTGADLNSHMTRVVVQRVSGTVNLYVNGTSLETATGQSSATPTSSAWALGGLPINTTYSYLGLETEEFVYTTTGGLTGTQLAAIDASEVTRFPDLGFATPYGATDTVAGIQAVGTQAVNVGNVLQYEYTQPWTEYAAIQMWGGASQGEVGGIIFTNVAASGAPLIAGYEVWVDNNCHLVSRIIQNFGSNEYIDVRALGVRLCDGQKHFEAVSYSGSGHASGIAMFLDGAQLTTTTGSDTVTGTIINSDENFQVDSQQGNIPLFSVVSHFQLDDVQRSPSYIEQYMTPTSLPPIDANTAISLKFQTGSGTTEPDASGNGNAGTLTDANMWVP
jgi:hypothetical protein